MPAPTACVPSCACLRADPRPRPGKVAPRGVSGNTYLESRRPKRKQIGSIAPYDPRQPEQLVGAHTNKGDSHAPLPFHTPAFAEVPRVNNRNFVKGVFLMVIATIFGWVATTYSVGVFSRSGPGLFPLMVSSFLFLIGLLTAVRSFFVERVPLDYSVKNIVLILASLVGFAVISEYVNMILGIVFLVFCSTLAGTSYSVVRNIKISVGLVAVAFAFRDFLGLNLPLY
jgi:hypothetical protein